MLSRRRILGRNAIAHYPLKTKTSKSIFPDAVMVMVNVALFVSFVEFLYVNGTTSNDLQSLLHVLCKWSGILSIFTM